MVPATTSIAGRHAADRARQRADAAAAQQSLELQQLAVVRLEGTLHMYGLITRPRVSHQDDDVHLWVDCRRDTCDRDRRLVYAVLDEQGWGPDTTRLSRIKTFYDVVRLKHKATGAQLSVIVSMPFAEVPHTEAA